MGRGTDIESVRTGTANMPEVGPLEAIFRDLCPLACTAAITPPQRSTVMELNKKQNTLTMASTDATNAMPDATAEAVVRTPEEIRQHTDMTAESLLAVGGGEAGDKIQRGRIINEYVRWIQPDGRYSKPNPFKLLAERKDLPWQASQLRAYRDTYLLWEQMGGKDGAPEVDVTTFGLVLSLGFEDAKKILDRAAKEKLTTRKVAELVKKAKGAGKAAKCERVAGDWQMLSKALESLQSEAGLMLKCPSEAPADGEIIDRIEILVKDLQAIIAAVTTPPAEGGAL